MTEIANATDQHFDFLQNVVTTTADAKKTQWALNAPWLTGTVIPLRTAWRSAYDAWIDPETRNKLLTAAKHTARKNYEPALHQLVEVLRSNPAVTEQDQRAMGIYLEPHSTNPIPPTDKYVEFEVEHHYRRLLIYFRVLGATDHAKPHGVHEVEIRWDICDKQPKSELELKHVDTLTRSPLTLDFTEEERGKVVYMCGRWKMRNSGHGPWSQSTYAVVP
jgi:hypothetical protein